MNVTHPQFLRNAAATKQGITNYSERQQNLNLSNINNLNLNNPYTNNNLRFRDAIGETEGLVDELGNTDLNQSNYVQRNTYHTANQNFFDVNKAQSTSHQHYYSKQNLNHQSLNVNKG